MFRITVLLIILLLAALPVVAESIEDCVPDEIIAVQSLSDGNRVRWTSDRYFSSLGVSYPLDTEAIADIQAERETVADYVPVLRDGQWIDTTFYWTGQGRHEALTFAFEGEQYMFVYDEANRPHGACPLLRLP